MFAKQYKQFLSHNSSLYGFFERKKMENLISITEAAEKGIEQLKKPEWKMIEDHLKIDIINNKPGPWMYLYSPFNKECNGRDPVDILSIEMGDLNKKEWIIYKGPSPNSYAYKNATASFKGVLATNT